LDQQRQHPNYQSRRGEFFSEGYRVKRERDSKRRHERKRSAEWLDKVGLIEQEFGESRFSALNPYAEPSGAGLDAIFQAGTVHRSIGLGSLTRLFGVSRRLLLPRLPRAPYCRSVRYDLCAVLLCMTSLLGANRCRWLCDLKCRKAVLKQIIARARDVPPPDMQLGWPPPFTPSLNKSGIFICDRDLRLGG